MGLKWGGGGEPPEKLGGAEERPCRRRNKDMERKSLLPEKEKRKAQGSFTGMGTVML